MPALSGLSLEEMASLLAPLPRFRAVQIFKWIASGVSSFEAMKNVPLALRKELSERFLLSAVAVEHKQSDEDGTAKMTLRLSDGEKVESVLLVSDSGRKTACLSTQAGCPAGCVFCKTGAGGFRRNLSSAEMVEQFLLLKKEAEDAEPEKKADAHPISNIVVMGMGEPLLNLAELRKALDLIISPDGMHFSRRRITVSTCGIADGIAYLADNGPAVRLALSLPSATETLRQQIMPIAASQSLANVKKACSYFQKKGGGRITLEVVLLGGINTAEEHAISLAKFGEKLDVAVNLIPWNPVKGLELAGRALRQPTSAEIKAFIHHLEAQGLSVTCRFRKGRGIMGACGQLGHLPSDFAAV
jgi:23S rRNA (adenine2503-C2)-methyltransferase